MISKAVIVEIDPLDEEQQIELFQLETGKSQEDSELFIKNFASKDILENPLHLSLVAKYGAEGNLYQIYDKVVRHKVEDSLNRKAVDKKRFEFGEIFADGLKDLQKLAINHIRGVELNDYTKDDLEKNNYYGIASFQNNHVIFIHQTLAEFLAAQHFLREIENSGDCDIQTSTEDIANLFLGESFSWCRTFVDLFYSTVLNDAEKIELHKASYLPVMKLNPDRFLQLIVSGGCINIFKMIYQNITFSNNPEGNCITVAKDRTLLVKAIEGAEEIAVMLLDIDLINSDDELLIILPPLLKTVAESHACLFFENLETKFPRLPEMIHSRRSIIEAGVVAASNNHDEILHLLLQNGVDKDFQNDEGNALYWAIIDGYIKCVEVLLKHGAKLAISDDGDSSDPLTLAVEVNNLDLVKFLLEEDISALQCNKKTLEINVVKSCLNSAIRHGHKEVAKLLIEKCPSFKNAKYGDDESLLQFSAKNSNLEMCQWLVDEEGEDVNTLRPSGEPRDWSRKDKLCMDHYLILQNVTDERGKTALHCAAEHGYLERVQELINSGANVRAVDKNGWNALHFACKSNSEEKEDVIRLLHSTDSQLSMEKTKSGKTGLHIHLLKSSHWLDWQKVRFLVEEIGVDVKAKDNNGCTALRIAFDKGRHFLDYLMEKDIDLEVKTKQGRTCLHFAAERGDLEALQTWIELGGDFNVVDEKGMTALHIAAERGHLQFVKKILDCATEEVQNQDLGEGCVGSKLKERLSRCDSKGRTALHLAAESGNVDLVKILLENAADLTLTDLEGKNAIHFAIRNERMLRFLNEKNGDLVKQCTKYGDTTLHLALDFHFNKTEDDEQIALWIIGQVDDTVLNAKNASGKTPLLLACNYEWWMVAKLLLTRNVEVNVSNWCGKTAMHYAAAEGNLDLVKLLLEKGADLTLTNDEGMNALHHAINNMEVFLFLQEKNNALLKQRLKNGNTILHRAVMELSDGTKVIPLILEQSENDLNATNSEGETPLLLACKRRKWIIAKILLAKTIDIDTKDKYGRTALHYAVNWWSNSDIKELHAFYLVEELLGRGADLALTDNDGKNAFHHAIKNFHMALFIHELNGDLVKQRLNNGDTSLQLAINLHGYDINDNILIWHIEQYLNVTNSKGTTPLILACKNGMWIIAKILVAKSADINAKDKKGRSALHYAVNLDGIHRLEDLSAFDLVQELCKRGADLAQTDNEGMNAFHHAMKNYDMALFIHELNGDLVKQRLNNGDTTLHLAIKLNEDNWNDNFGQRSWMWTPKFLLAADLALNLHRLARKQDASSSPPHPETWPATSPGRLPDAPDLQN
ncbi:serine/threonine-protein phosphatase 6 regulatory ankyrin repeat subunit B-like [Cloeon dipterum]|uniref:serine/threonine-protein phosphatase 6 regulatory ankyrin repeat subunit B-like n=1 Tax=Cloeon dipterum TaxID=197152 RepID=UPI00321FEE24